jgi:hypothetical protein
MKYLANLKELTFSEILSIAIVFTVPLLIGYSILT